MLANFLIFIISLIGLLFSADYFVDQAVLLSKKLKLPKIVVGLTVVAVGTSLPEAAASAIAALSGHPEMALGNVIGSNICNIALILGIPALISPIKCRYEYLIKDGLIMLFLSFFLWGLTLYKSQISGLTSYFFLAGFAAYIFYTLKYAGSNEDERNFDDDLSEDGGKSNSSLFISLRLAGAMVAIVVFAKFLVDSSSSLATLLGVSENVIALSLIAIGTSLPELSVALSAIKKGESGLLVGGIIGSNISNILLVLGLASFLSPINIQAEVGQIDMPIMVLCSMLMLLFLSQKSGINFIKGITLLVVYSMVIGRFFLAS